MAFTSKYGVSVFFVSSEATGTGVIFKDPVETPEGQCARRDCEQNAVGTIDLPISACSPFGSNISFLYEKHEDRVRIPISVCGECLEPNNGAVYMIDESLCETTLCRHTFSLIGGASF